MFANLIVKLKNFFDKKEVLPRAEDLEFLAPSRVAVKKEQFAQYKRKDNETDNIPGIEKDNENNDLLLDNETLEELEKEYDKIYKEENRHKFEVRKEKLLERITDNIRQLHPISEELFEKGFKKYYDKVVDLIEQSNSFARILRRLDVSKPYAKELIATIKKQTMLVNELIIKLYSD